MDKPQNPNRPKTPFADGGATPHFSGPMILGDLRSLEGEYESQKKNHKNVKKIISQESEPEKNITLEPHAFQNTISPKMKEETTLDDISKDLPKIFKNEIPQEVHKELKKEPIKSISPVVKPQIPPPLAKKPPSFSSPKPEVHPVVNRRVPRLGSALTVGGLLFLFFVGVILYLAWFHPLRAIAFLERLRLQKMYGRVTLDQKILAKFYIDDGQLKKAEATYKGLVENSTQDPLLQIALGQVQWDLGKRQDACNHFAAAIKSNPSAADGHWGLGWCYLYRGELGRAKREFYLYLAAEPHSPKSQDLRRMVESFP